MQKRFRISALGYRARRNYMGRFFGTEVAALTPDVNTVRR